jgi:hypothetical protein
VDLRRATISKKEASPMKDCALEAPVVRWLSSRALLVVICCFQIGCTGGTDAEHSTASDRPKPAARPDLRQTLDLAETRIERKIEELSGTFEVPAARGGGDRIEDHRLEDRLVMLCEREILEESGVRQQLLGIYTYPQFIPTGRESAVDYGRRLGKVHTELEGTASEWVWTNAGAFDDMTMTFQCLCIPGTYTDDSSTRPCVAQIEHWR